MVHDANDRICEDIVGPVLAGERLSAANAVFLLKKGSLHLLGAAADEVRRRRYPESHATFLIDRNINYTNVCVTRCSFCAFHREIGHPESYLLSRDDILRRVEEAVELGGTQIMLQGGNHPRVGIEYFEDLFASIKARFPQVALHSLSPSEILHTAHVSRLSMSEAVRRLKRAGLDSLPGGGAEILVDRVRRAVGRQHPATAEWLGVMEEAHRQGMRTTATMMLGSVESLEERIEHLGAVRSLQDRAGPGAGFRAFIPWKYQPGNTRLGGDLTSSFDYLRTLALSRLFLDNVDHIQGGWLTPGKDVGQISLSFGADDFGSIMLEENVVRAAGVTRHMTSDEIIRLIRAADRIPAQRDTSYNIIRVFGES
ncbi:MAG: dehypoxanthine futalosine cyclase [Chloroflexota bacterium]|nr:MAG: dehypoxanthine futalosine cyclase [Chloroflexota bacterium]